MKAYHLIDKFVSYAVNKSFKVIIRLTGRLSVKRIKSVLFIYGMCLLPHFRKQFRSDSAKLHTTEFCQASANDFIIDHVMFQLFSQYLRRYLFLYPREKCEDFVKRSTQCISDIENKTPTKIYLCTHTGDYWLSIINIAFQYRRNPAVIKRLIVPIFELVTEENNKVFSKIEIPDFDVIFINIHEPGALKSIVSYLKDDASAVAIFYDLFCYAAGTANGAVENIKFFNRSAYMTTGFSSLVVRLKLPTKFVSTHYCQSAGKYITTLTSTKIYEDVDVLKQAMVCFIETYIIKYPPQWYFIAYLDTFYHYPFSALQQAQSKTLNSYLRLQHKFTA